MANYPNEEFQGIYDSILASMGDDATIKANLEAALRPMYDQSVEQLRQQRIANNAAIDVDAASRGMGNSTWVTDAKLRQLRGESDNLAALNANYNNQLFTALLDATKDRDNNAYNQAMQWFQYNNAGKGGGGTPTPSGFFDGTRWWNSREEYEKALGNTYDSTTGGVDKVKNSLLSALAGNALFGVLSNLGTNKKPTQQKPGLAATPNPFVKE